MAVQYAPLFSLETQFQAKNGSNNTAGFLRVYLAATDDPAETYSDYYGTRNPDKIILDDNGRAVVICDKAKAYRLEVYDADGMLLWTEEPVYCSGNGGGGVSVTTVESTDGSIAVESSVVGSNRIYDLSIAPDNAKELLEWVKTDNEAVSDGPIRPAYAEGTMDVYAGQGIEVSDAGLYHVTVNLDVTPSGNGINYETLSIFLMLDDGSDTPVTLCQHDFDVDNSLSDKVELEFAYDLTGKGDGKLYLVVSGVTPFQNVDVSLQMHRIYSGINAVPRSIASRTWVEENISSKIDYSALEYNQQNLITGISGSAIAANSVDPTEFIPWSASGTFQPSGEYLTATASSLFQPSGDYLSASESSNYYPMTGNPSGFIRDEECQSSYVSISSFSAYSADVESSITGISSFVSGLTGTYIEQSASSMFQPSGQYIYESAFSSYSSTVDSSITSISSFVSGLTGTYIEQSASSMFQPSGNYLSSSDSSLFQPSGSYLSSTDSSLFQPSGSYVSASDMSSYVPYSAVSGEDNTVTSINGSAIKGHEYSGVYPVNVDNVNDLIAVDHTGLAVDNETLSAFVSGDSIVLKVIDGIYQQSGDYLSASESSNYYSTGNPSSFVTESYVDSAVSGKLDVTASSQFLTSLPDDLAYTSDVASAVSGKMDKSESSSFYPMDSNPSGYLTAHQSLAGYATEQYVDSSVSGKLDATAYDSAKFQLTADMSAYQLSGDYAYNSSLSSKLDASASSDFQTTADMSGYYTTANESGFITGLPLDITAGNVSASGHVRARNSHGDLYGNFDYAGMYFHSGTQRPYSIGIDATGSNFYIATAKNKYERIYASSIQSWNAKQDASAMTAYQPVGTYIYESALGWAEV